MPQRLRFAGILLALLGLALGLLPTNGQIGRATGAPAPAPASAPLFIIQLAGEPLAVAAADLRGPAAGRQRARLEARRAAVLRAITAELGASPAVVQTYDTAFHGVALPISAGQAARVAALPGVLAVWPEQHHRLDSDAGPAWVGAGRVWGAQATGVYAATILGANQQPPVATDLAGRGVFSLAGATLSATVTLTGSIELISAVSIRRSGDGALVGSLAAGAAGIYAGSLSLGPGDLALLQSGGLLVRVETAGSPGGAASGAIAGYQGEGVVVGVIDSGINTGHPAFAEVGGDGYRHLNPLGQGVFRGACDPANLPGVADGNPSGYNPAIRCNNKLIGAWTFAQTAPVPNAATGAPSPNDENGHGSHTASTAAGNVLLNVRLNGATFPRIAGVAPRASLIAYDVCGVLVNGAYRPDCSSAAILAAIDQAVRDGVDVLNYSISGNGNPWADPVELAFLGARAAGVVVSASAGNNGPTPGSVAHVSPWLLSVAAATHNRRFGNGLAGLQAEGGATLPDIGGAGASTTFSNNLPIVYAGAPAIGNPRCGAFSQGQAALVAGAIVICDRGAEAPGAAAGNVQAAGGAGIVLANDAATGSALADTFLPIPGVIITYTDGVTLKSWVAASASPTARISNAVPRLVDADGDIVASFSSRGPVRDETVGVLKPDLTAPGVSVLAAIADSGGAAPNVGLLSGTSMAAPHAAGAAALLAGLHPGWTPGQIQAALTTTALAPITKSSGAEPTTPFDSGAGRVRVDLAARAGLVLDETVERFQAASPAAGGDPRALNTPAMADPRCVVECRWTRTLRNTLARPVTWSVTTEGAGLTAAPSSFSIPAGGTQVLTVTFDVSGGVGSGEYRFGRVILRAAGDVAPEAGLPVAALPARSDLPRRLVITGTTGIAERALDLQLAPYSGLGAQAYGLARGSAHRLALAEGAPQVTTLQVPAGAARLVAEIESSTSRDIDLVVYRDTGSGTLETNRDEVACISASSAVLESCAVRGPQAGTYFVWVDNYEASAAPPDQTLLITAVVPQGDAGNLRVRAPGSGAGAVRVTVAVSAVSARPGERWYGWLRLLDGAGGEIGAAEVVFRHVGTTGPEQVFLPAVGQ